MTAGIPLVNLARPYERHGEAQTVLDTLHSVLQAELAPVDR